MLELPRKKKAAGVALIIIRIVNAKTRANSSLTPSSISLSSSFREEEEKQ